ncbi:MAG: hypothetical protein V1663_03850 [archaeon]
MNQKDGDSKKHKKLFLFLKKNFAFSIEDMFTIAVIAFVIMILTLIIKPEIFGVTFKANVSITAYIYYLLMFTSFKYVYFLFVIFFIVLVCKKLLKHRWTTKIKVLSLILGITFAFSIFFSIPSEDFNSAAAEMRGLNSINAAFGLYSSVDNYTQMISSLKPGESIPDSVPPNEGVKNPKLVKNSNGSNLYWYAELDNEFCGDEILYLFTLGCGSKEIYDSIIKNVQLNINTSIKYYCVGFDSKEECESNGYVYPENYSEFRLKYKIAGITQMPQVIIGCKYAIGKNPTVEDITNIICEKIGDCSK